MDMTKGISRRSLLRRGAAVGAGLMMGNAFGGLAYGQSAIPVKIINSSGVLGQAMQNVMEEKGFGRKLGVDLQYENIASGNQIVSGLIGGSGEACMFSGFPQVLPAIEKGGPLKIIGGCSMVPLLAVFSAKPEIKSVRDLVGKNVGSGATGSLLHMGMVALLRKYGIDEKQVNFVNLGSSPAVFNAMVEGVVDAGLSEIEVTGLTDELKFHMIDEGYLAEQLPEFCWQAAYASERAIAGNREGVVRALAAHALLYRYLQGPDSWDSFNNGRTKFAGREDRKSARAYWDFIQQRQPFAVDIVLPPRSFDFVQDLNISLGNQTTKLDYEKVTDMSLAAEALELIKNAG